MLGAKFENKGDLAMNKFIKIFLFCLIILGVIYNITLIFSFDKKYPENIKLKAIAKVVSLKNEKENSNSYTVKIINSNLKSAKNTKIILYTSKMENFMCGDIIQISGEFSKHDVARNYKGFNYRKYLKQSKIHGSIYCKNIKILDHKSSLLERIYILKESMLKKLDEMYDKDESSFLKGILLR